jgi:serine/threonine protein kinase
VGAQRCVLVRRYRIEEKLGAGGMGEVFRAQQRGAEGFSRSVALKRISSPLSHDERFASLFIAEARIAALLSHPNIVTVFDFDRDEDGALFLAMELVDGADLRRLLERAEGRGTRLSPPLAAFVASEVLRALAYAHELLQDGRPLGIVHRDVSPHNVLVSKGGVVKLSDFGIAKATAVSQVSSSGAIRGKVAYLSPEQASGKPLDGRCDLHAVGVMLYETLAGSRPYQGNSEAEVLAQVLRGCPVPLMERAPAVPHDLAEITMRLFAPDPDLRFATANEAILALKACACFPKHGEVELAELVRTLVPESTATPSASPDSSAGPASAKPTRATTTTGKVRRSRRSLAILGVVAALSVTAAVLAWMVPTPRAPRPPPTAVEPVPVPVAPPADPEPVRPVVEPQRPAGAQEPVLDRKSPHGERDTTAPAKNHVTEASADAAPPALVVSAVTPGQAALDSGTISVRVRPWGIVTVDGVKWGLTPVKRVVPLGKRRVTIKNEDLGKVENLVLEVEPGEEISLERDWQ